MKACVIDHMDCAHHLIGHGKCERPHGHTYRVEVEMEVDPASMGEGFFQEKKAIIHRILDGWDHFDLNERLDFPSCEHIAVGLFHEIREQIPETLSVKAWEGKYKWSHIHRDDPESSFHPRPAQAATA